MVIPQLRAYRMYITLTHITNSVRHHSYSDFNLLKINYHDIIGNLAHYLSYSNNIKFMSSLIMCKYVIDCRYKNETKYIITFTITLSILVKHENTWKWIEHIDLYINSIVLYETINDYTSYSNSINQNRYRNDCFCNPMVNKTHKNKYISEFAILETLINNLTIIDFYQTLDKQMVNVKCIEHIVQDLQIILHIIRLF
eukprot:324574_1